MSQQRVCPNLEELELLAAGRLPELKHAELERHVLNCVSCQDRLAAIDRSDDALEELIKLVPESSSTGLNDSKRLIPGGYSRASRGNDSTDLFPEVLGDYRLVREVGRGGMGIVFEAVQSRLNRRVALKVLPFLNFLDPSRLKRFQNESRAAASL